MRAFPLIALAALSCSPAPTTGPESDRNTADAAAMPVAAPTPTSVADTDAPPTPGALKTFDDWTVGCDNILSCQANALVPEVGDRDAYLLLLLTRDAGPDAPLRLVVPLPTASRQPMTLAVDGKTFATLAPDRDGSTATLTLDRARAARLADGQRVTLAPVAGGPVTASLKGLAATMLYIDDQQRRVGTTSASRKPGPATSPAAPAVPTLGVPPVATAGPRTLTVSAATRLIGPDNAFCDYAIGPVQPEAHRLDATHSLVLVPHPCGNGAYNMFSSGFIVDEQGRATPARYDAPPGIAEEDNGDLINAGWDDTAHRLTTYGKGRGVGDCGTAQAFAWDGTRFRLTDLHAMGECRGSIDFIRLWTRATETR